jgi:hypothetical protein
MWLSRLPEEWRIDPCWFATSLSVASQAGEGGTTTGQSDEMVDATIARAVQAQYARLGKTGKPQAGEWTVLAGFVLSRGSGAADEVVALGTGTKCLTRTQVAQDGAGWLVHDAHAEVCARRSLLLYFLDQLELTATRPLESVFVAADSGGYVLRPGMSLHMYSSQPPCGDAALFEALADGEPMGSPDTDAPAGPKRQRLEADMDAHRTGARPAAAAECAEEAAGGGLACKLGLVRTKPGRGERTCCMSCSDKLARWVRLGLQGALLSLLLPTPVRPAHVCPCPCPCVPMCAHVCPCVPMCICICMHMHMCNMCICMHMHMCNMCMCMFAHVCPCVPMCCPCAWTCCT